MDYNSYLKNNQKIPYQVFLNALKNDKLFHAYLLVGPNGTPLLQIAKYIAKCILSEQKDFVTEDSDLTDRIENNNYADLRILDGKENSIKIDDIRQLEDIFSKTSTEANGKKIYIINVVENMAPDATNALLKFLEEPDKNTFAFLTTENEFSVLPTIRSRCELIHFSTLNQDNLINEAKLAGIPLEDAELLSYFYNDVGFIETESKDEDYQNAKTLVLDFLGSIQNKNECRFLMENSIIPTLKTKPSIRFFLDLLIVFLKEALKYKLHDKVILNSYEAILNSLVKYNKNLEDNILNIMNYRNELNYNVNTSLLFVNLVDTIFGD